MYGAGRVEVLDLSSLHSPALLGSVTLSIGGADYIALSGAYAYIGSWAGISAVDVSNPTSPRETDWRGLPSNVHGLDVEGKFLYVATGEGLSSYDISDPARLVPAGGYTGIWATDVIVEGQFAYVTANTQRLYVLDVSIPSAPAVVRVLNTCGASKGMAISSRYLYVADGCRSIEAFDVSGSSEWAAMYGDLPGFGEQIVLDGTTVAVAAGPGGVAVLESFEHSWDVLPPGGGTLISPDGKTSVTVPADTYPADTFVGYEELPRFGTGTLVPAGPFFSLMTANPESGELVRLPQGKGLLVTVTYPRSPARPETLQLYELDGAGNWTPLGSTVDTDAGRVTTQLTSFSGKATFVLMGETHRTYLPGLRR